MFVDQGRITDSNKISGLDQGGGTIDNCAPAAGLQTIGSKCILWMGQLKFWADKKFIKDIWFDLGYNVDVKIIRDKYTGGCLGYCFLKFENEEAASQAIKLNGTNMDQMVLSLNWASSRDFSETRSERATEYSIFVGDLGSDATESKLFSVFQSKYPSCTSAKLIIDPITQSSRGYGFVRFLDEAEQQKALVEMQGVYIGNTPLRVSTATPKSKTQAFNHLRIFQIGLPPIGFYGTPQPMNQFTDPNNTTIFVGGLSSTVTEDELRLYFQSFGEISYVKIPPGKRCGFVQFVQRNSAELAMEQMQNYSIGNSSIHLSWGRSQNISGSANSLYKPAQPPPVQASLGFPPQHDFTSLGPLNPHAAQLQHSQHQTGSKLTQLSIQSILQNPMAEISVSKLNDIYQSQLEARHDRLEAEGSFLHPIHYT